MARKLRIDLKENHVSLRDETMITVPKKQNLGIQSSERLLETSVTNKKYSAFAWLISDWHHSTDVEITGTVKYRFIPLGNLNRLPLGFDFTF